MYHRSGEKPLDPTTLEQAVGLATRPVRKDTPPKDHFVGQGHGSLDLDIARLSCSVTLEKKGTLFGEDRF